MSVISKNKINTTGYYERTRNMWSFEFVIWYNRLRKRFRNRLIIWRKAQRCVTSDKCQLKKAATSIIGFYELLSLPLFVLHCSGEIINESFQFVWDGNNMNTELYAWYHIHFDLHKSTRVFKINQINCCITVAYCLFIKLL